MRGLPEGWSEGVSIGERKEKNRGGSSFLGYFFHDCKRRSWTVFHLRSSGMTTTNAFALDFFELFSLSLLILSVDN